MKRHQEAKELLKSILIFCNQYPLLQPKRIAETFWIRHGPPTTSDFHYWSRFNLKRRQYIGFHLLKLIYDWIHCHSVASSISWLTSRFYWLFFDFMFNFSHSLLICFFQFFFFNFRFQISFLFVCLIFLFLFWSFFHTSLHRLFLGSACKW